MLSGPDGLPNEFYKSHSWSCMTNPIEMQLDSSTLFKTVNDKTLSPRNSVYTQLIAIHNYAVLTSVIAAWIMLNDVSLIERNTAFSELKESERKCTVLLCSLSLFSLLQQPSHWAAGRVCWRRCLKAATRSPAGLLAPPPSPPPMGAGVLELGASCCCSVRLLAYSWSRLKTLGCL